MNKIAKVARVLERRLFASLSREDRIIHAFIHIAVDTASAFGNVVYAEFIKKNVQGMPDIRGVPAAEVNPRRLPSDYGVDFGKSAMRVLHRLGFSPDKVNDFLAEFTLNFISQFSRNLREGVTLHEAQSFVMQKLAWEARSFRKGERKQLNRMSPNSEDIIDNFISDPFGKDMMHLSPRTMVKLMDYLKKTIHEDAPVYLDLLSQGYTDKEIAEEGLLPTLGVLNPSTLYKKIKQPIAPAVEKFFKSQEVN